MTTTPTTTATTTTTPATPGATPVIEPGARTRLRRNRAAVGLVVLVLAVTALLAWAGGNRSTGALDPQAVDPDGSRALARILEGQGVRVVRVERAADAAAALRAAPAATLLVTVPGLVSPRMAAALAGVAVDHVVLVGAVPDAPGPWTRSLTVAGAVPVGERDPACSWPIAVRAGSADTGGTVFTTTTAGASSCYDASVLDVPGATGAVTALGSGRALTNAALADAGNASLALGVLGRDPVLVWWLPTYADPLYGAGGPAPTVTDLIPAWVTWALVQLGIAVLVLAYARGRRFGPVISEPLPVTVRASEATEGLARLYRRAGGREHAAGLLAVAAVARLRSALALPRTVPTPALARAVAGRTGRPVGEVLALLDPPAPADDAALVQFAHDLDELERQVRHP